jgi:hypothetical protein
MAQFPLTEAEIVSLAQAIITGLKAHPDEFPSPPVNFELLQQQLNDVLTSRDEATTLQTRASEAVARTRKFLEALIASMKLALKYCEQVAPKEKWSLLGWGSRAEPVALQAPGQPRNLECLRRGDNSIQLDWKAPKDGGKVGVFHIERRIMPNGEWTLLTTSFGTEIILTDQPKGNTLEFRVIAHNKEGHGIESNVVTVIL